MNRFVLESNMTSIEKFYKCNKILACIDSQFRQNKKATIYIDDKKIYYSEVDFENKIVLDSIKEICSVVGLDTEEYFRIEEEELKKNNDIW